MNAEIQTLKAEIAADLGAIAEIYGALDQVGADLRDEQQRIVVAYYLHNLYCAFESIFQRVADVFGNHISDRAGWHADRLALVHRKARVLEQVYKTDIQQFVGFLDDLTQVADA